jgi:hypothetical protein
MPLGDGTSVAVASTRWSRCDGGDALYYSRRIMKSARICSQVLSYSTKQTSTQASVQRQAWMQSMLPIARQTKTPPGQHYTLPAHTCHVATIIKASAERSVKTCVQAAAATRDEQKSLCLFWQGLASTNRKGWLAKHEGELELPPAAAVSDGMLTKLACHATQQHRQLCIAVRNG